MFPNGSPMLGMSGMTGADQGVSPYQPQNQYQQQQQDPTQALLAQLSQQQAGSTIGQDTPAAQQGTLGANPLTAQASQVQPMTLPSNPLISQPGASSTATAAPATSSPTASSAPITSPQSSASVASNLLSMLMSQKPTTSSSQSGNSGILSSLLTNIFG